jgi:nicotinate-nucleotide adenylyltransferase
VLNRPIGLYGGTFAPVHNGHVRAAIEARERLDLAELRVIPAACPPHRPPPPVDAARRLQWLQQAFAGEAGVVVDDDELRHSGPSYTVETLARFRARYPDIPLVWLVGTDSFNSLHTWHQWPRLFELAHVGVLRRPGHDFSPAPALMALPALAVADIARKPSGGWLAIDIPELDISSTAIRQRITEGRSLRGLLPDAVRQSLHASDFADLTSPKAS